MVYETRVGKRGPKAAKDRSERRDYVVGPFRVTQEEREALTAGALEDEMSIGVWLLHLGMKRRNAQLRRKS